MTESSKTLLRKVTDKNIDSGNATLNDSHLASFYNGEIDRITIIREDGTILESYYGAGLRKLIESAHQHRSGKFVLVKRFFAPKDTKED